MTYRDWILQPPTLGWELKAEMCQSFFDEPVKMRKRYLMNYAYGQRLMREMKK